MGPRIAPRLLVALVAILCIAGCGRVGGCGRSGPTAESPSAASATEPRASLPATTKKEPAAAAGDGGEVTVARPEPIEPTPTEQSTKEYSRAINDLGIELLQRVPDEGNLVLSPVSVHAAVLLAWLGSEGQTRAELGKALGIEGRSAPEKIVASLLREWNDPELAHAELRVVNRLFGDHTLEAKDVYQQAAQRYFAAPLDRVDFKEAPEPSRIHINEWVAGQTNERIEDLIPSGAINGQTRAVLVNAAYFLAAWHHPFGEDATRVATFFAPGGPKEVLTMHRVGMLRYGELSDVSVLEVPYKNGRFAMLFVLPKSNRGLPELERQLTGARLRHMVDALETRRVEVALPRFEIEGEAMALKEVLRTLGVKRAFARNDAEFTRITEPDDPEERLFLAEVLHKGYVRVDERGTEAAAATATVMRSGRMPPADPEEFIADHPFLFALRDVSSDAILFLGRVTDPA